VDSRTHTRAPSMLTPCRCVHNWPAAAAFQHHNHQQQQRQQQDVLVANALMQLLYSNPPPTSSSSTCHAKLSHALALLREVVC
jgi:hypothetical protein